MGKKKKSKGKKKPDQAEYDVGVKDARILRSFGFSDRFLGELILHLSLGRKVDWVEEYSYCEGLNDKLFGKRN